MNDLFIQGLTIDWNRVRPYNYVRQIPAISGIDTFTFHKPITFFVGENGSGKSTLLETCAKNCEVSVWQRTSGSACWSR